MSSNAAGSRWDGGVSPYGVSWRKMMMWYFIITDGILFASFLAAYGFARLGSESWPDPFEIFHGLYLITVMTFVLISSSATMATAVTAAQRGDQSRTVKNLFFTIGGGVIFLLMQAYEWGSLIKQGATLTANPWGDPHFSMYFFTITGFHGTHVLSGVLVLLIVALKAKAGKCSAEGVELAGLYWHFVDLVWVFVFGCFYLI